MMTLPVGTATVERFFSYLKIVKSRLRSRLSDENFVDRLIVIEGPELENNFEEVLVFFKLNNRRIRL